MSETLIKDKKTTKVDIIQTLPKIQKSTVKKIGSIPFGYTETDIVYIDNGKIYIAKPSK